jgi:hypothetical protein
MDSNWQGLHMREINRAERLLSLFTSPDSAAGIVGDLSEERGQRGSVWFWRHVLGTVLSLGRGALFEAPGVVLALAVMGFLLLAVLTLIVSGAVSFVARWINPSVPLQLLLFGLLSLPTQVALWCYTASLTGRSLVTASPRRGMLACVLLFCAVEVLLLFLGINSPAHAPLAAWWVIWTMGLAAPIFLLRGACKVRRRQMTWLA